MAEFSETIEVADEADPVFRTIHMLAHEEKNPLRETAAAPAAAVDVEAKAVKAALDRKDLELKARRQQAEAEKLNQQRREVQMKQYAAATKASEAAKAAAADDSDTPESRQEMLRQIGLMRQMLETPGTGRRCTADTKLRDLQAELGVMHSQANLERAHDAPRDTLVHLMRLAEAAAWPLADFRGSADQFQRQLDESARSTDPMKKHLDKAMLQASIKYSSWFAMSPEMYLVVAYANIARAQYEANQGRSRAEAATVMSDEIAREFERFNVQGDDEGDAESPQSSADAGPPGR